MIREYLSQSTLLPSTDVVVVGYVTGIRLRRRFRKKATFNLYPFPSRLPIPSLFQFLSVHIPFVSLSFSTGLSIPPPSPCKTLFAIMIYSDFRRLLSLLSSLGCWLAFCHVRRRIALNNTKDHLYKLSSFQNTWVSLSLPLLLSSLAIPRRFVLIQWWTFSPYYGQQILISRMHPIHFHCQSLSSNLASPW